MFAGRYDYKKNGLVPSSYRKTPRLSILVLGNFLGGGTEMLTFERS